MDTSAGVYRLEDTTRGNGIATYNGLYGLAQRYYTDNDNAWTASEFHNANNDDAGLEAHWDMEKTYDYFYNTFGRNSYDGHGAKIKSTVNFTFSVEYPGQNENAAWGNSQVVFGKGLYQPYVCLSVAAHELGHGICQYSANLGNSGESGALNESLGDIWGVCVSAYAKPNLGENIWIHGYGLDINRHLSHPEIDSIPKYYGGRYWCDASNLKYDQGGVHINCGVMSYWFYLLSHGGTITNEVDSVYEIDGLGIDKAARICYQMLTTRLTSTSKYADARICSIQAAGDLYGSNSEEVEQVMNAWAAVGVGSRFHFFINGPKLVGVNSNGIFTCVSMKDVYTVDVSPNVSLVSRSGNLVTVKGLYNGRGFINIKNGNTIIGSYSFWVGGPIVTDVAYSNGYLTAYCLNGDAAITKTDWIIGSNMFTSYSNSVYCSSTGTFNVSVIAYNSCGASNEYITQISTNSDGRILISKNEHSNLITIKNISTDGISNGINPVSSGLMQYTLINMASGKTERRGSLPEEGGTLDFGAIGKGLYVLHLHLSNGNSESYKITLE